MYRILRESSLEVDAINIANFAAAGSFTTKGGKTQHVNGVLTFVKTTALSHNLTMTMQQSTDGSNWSPVKDSETGGNVQRAINSGSDAQHCLITDCPNDIYIRLVVTIPSPSATGVINIQYRG